MNSNRQRRYATLTHLCCLWHHSQPSWDLWKSTTVMIRRVRACIKSNGSHFEYLLVKNETKW